MISLVKDLNSIIESQLLSNPHRGYLGISQLGHSCTRYLYYVLHNAYNKEIYPRTKRIWDRGNWEEERVINDLKNIGCIVDSEQDEINIYGGHIKGHIDGIAKNVPGYKDETLLLEIKTMASTYWLNARQKGIKITNYSYWIQAQLYAYYSAKPITGILFVLVNKNDEMRHFEYVELDDSIIDEIEEKIHTVLTAIAPPQKIGSASWWECKLCSMNEYCHYGAEVNKCCSSCIHSVLLPDNVKKCSINGPNKLCEKWNSCV